jgi:hypothetical protein
MTAHDLERLLATNIEIRNTKSETNPKHKIQMLKTAALRKVALAVDLPQNSF